MTSFRHGKSITAPTAAIALTGMPSGSRTKKPTSSRINTIQPVRNVAGSLIAFAGDLSRGQIVGLRISLKEQVQHHQRGANGGNIDRHHHRRIFGESQPKEVRRDDIHQVRHNKRQAGRIGDKPGSHHEGQRRALAES